MHAHKHTHTHTTHHRANECELMERSVSLLLSLTREHSNSHKYSYSYPICPEIHNHPRRDLTAVTDQLQKVWAYCLHNPLNLPCSSQSDLILVSGLIAVSDINWKLHMNQQITWQYYINKHWLDRELSCVDMDTGLCDGDNSKSCRELGVWGEDITCKRICIRTELNVGRA